MIFYGNGTFIGAAVLTASRQQYKAIYYIYSSFSFQRGHLGPNLTYPTHHQQFLPFFDPTARVGPHVKFRGSQFRKMYRPKKSTASEAKTYADHCEREVTTRVNARVDLLLYYLDAPGYLMDMF